LRSSVRPRYRSKDFCPFATAIRSSRSCSGQSQIEGGQCRARCFLFPAFAPGALDGWSRQRDEPDLRSAMTYLIFSQRICLLQTTRILRYGDFGAASVFRAGRNESWPRARALWPFRPPRDWPRRDRLRPRELCSQTTAQGELETPTYIQDGHLDQGPTPSCQPSKPAWIALSKQRRRLPPFRFRLSSLPCSPDDRPSTLLRASFDCRRPAARPSRISKLARLSHVLAPCLTAGRRRWTLDASPSSIGCTTRVSRPLAARCQRSR
jgi:hypothetical protein